MRIFVYEYLSTGAMAGLPGAASLASEGFAMLAAVAADLAACPGVEVVTMACAEIADRLRQTPRLAVHSTSPEQEEATFRRLARGSDRALVIAPEFDDLLARRAEWALEEGCELLGPSPLGIRLTGDKLWLARHLKQHRVPTPETAVYAGGECPFDSVVVVKPRFGAGAQATYLVCHLSHYAAIGECARAGGWAGPLLVQSAHAVYLYTPASVALLVGPEGATALMPCSQEIDYGDWRQPVVPLVYQGGRLPLDPALHVLAIDLAGRALAAVPGLWGFVGVDLLLLNPPEQAGLVIEINPRLTTSYVGLRRLARFNIMQAMLAVLEGKSPGPLEYAPGKVAFLPDGTVT